MKKPFEKLYGQRVYLNMPKVPSNKIYLSDDALKEWMEKEKLSISRWKVYAVGENISHINEGDEVFVDAMGIMRATIVKLTKELSVLCISSMDIAHKWEKELYD